MSDTKKYISNNTIRNQRMLHYQEQYHINTVQEEFRELIKLKSAFQEKYKKYKKIFRTNY